MHGSPSLPLSISDELERRLNQPASREPGWPGLAEGTRAMSSRSAVLFLYLPVAAGPCFRGALPDRERLDGGAAARPGPDGWRQLGGPQRNLNPSPTGGS